MYTPAQLAMHTVNTKFYCKQLSDSEMEHSDTLKERYILPTV